MLAQGATAVGRQHRPHESAAPSRRWAIAMKASAAQQHARAGKERANKPRTWQCRKRRTSTTTRLTLCLQASLTRMLWDPVWAPGPLSTIPNHAAHIRVHNFGGGPGATRNQSAGALGGGCPHTREAAWPNIAAQTTWPLFSQFAAVRDHCVSGGLLDDRCINNVRDGEGEATPQG